MIVILLIIVFSEADYGSMRQSMHFLASLLEFLAWQWFWLLTWGPKGSMSRNSWRGYWGFNGLNSYLLVLRGDEGNGFLE